ncbi:MAG: PilT/PilU family type 4a pilus ATPase [Sedimentisphaerales bacterium]|nr:PilT/PilU family type 4a pilus ATPase [Sedimentisphaerales bacterium]
MVEGQPIKAEKKLEDEPRLYKFFRAAVKTRASDLHLKVGQPAKLRLYGQLKNTTGEVMTAEMIEQMVFEILSPAQKELFLKEGTLDFAHEIGGEDRFRINVFRQRGVASLVARRVNSTVPPFEELHLPAVLEKICDLTQGLILVVGPAGGGKTTTIAAMIDFINRTQSCHIVTLEDPIEYLFQDKKARVTQREIGLDVKDYDEALKYLVRQDPDVVFVGEMRDARTVAAGMRVAETGRLVFGTMHSANASQAVQRLLDLFAQNERDLARQMLSLTVKAIISQMLVPSIKEGVGRMPVMEILLANPAVHKLISEGREADLPSVIRSCQNEGMQDFTYSFCELIKDGSVDPKEAYKIAPNIEELKMALKGIRSTTSGIL